MKRKTLSAIFTFVFAFIFANSVFASAIFPVSTTAPQVAACPATPNYYDPDFCSTFPVVAICQCKAEGAPGGWCVTAHQIYGNIMRFFKSVTAGCNYAIAHGVIPAGDLNNCRYRWHCFISGGSFNGKECQGTGDACPGNGN